MVSDKAIKAFPEEKENPGEEENPGEDENPNEDENSDEEHYESELIEPDVLDDSHLPVQFQVEEEEPEDFDLEDELENSSSLVVTSALTRYLAEIRRYSLLTLEEERSLAFAAWEQNDIKAKHKLVTANLRLVVKIAMEYRRAYTQILDLIQEGNAGLVQAVNRFNPYKGVKLSTYSAWWIRAYILKFLMDNKSLVRMGTTDAQRKLFFRLRSEAEKMYALTQKFDAKLLAERIGVQENDVIEMQERLTKNDLSLDTPLSPGGDVKQIDILPAHAEEPDLKIAREQVLKVFRTEVGEVEKELNEREKFIYKHRIMAEDPITLQDIGEKYGITRERARQLESKILKKIKERMLKRGINESI